MVCGYLQLSVAMQRLAARCGQSSQPNQSSGDGNKCLESSIDFVVARRNVAKVLAAAEEALDEVAILVLVLIEWLLDKTMTT